MIPHLWWPGTIPHLVTREAAPPPGSATRRRRRHPGIRPPPFLHRLGILAPANGKHTSTASTAAVSPDRAHLAIRPLRYALDLGL